MSDETQQQPADATVNATGSETTNGGQGGTVTLTESELKARIEEQVRKRLDRERKKAEEDAERIRSEAQAEAAKQQGDYKQVAEQLQARLDKAEGKAKELGTVAERVAALEALIAAHVTKEREGLPAPVLTLLDTQPVEAQYQWLVTNKAALVTTPTTPAGVPPTPAPSDGKLSAEEKARRAIHVRQIW